MIRQRGSFFLLETKHTSYAFHILKSGQAEHLYYGRKFFLPGGTKEKGSILTAETLSAIADTGEESEEAKVQWIQTLEALREKGEHLPGNCVAYSKEYPALALEDICLEFSSVGKGDIREPFIELSFEDGSSTCDFIFQEAEVLAEKKKLKTLPSSYDEENMAQTLRLSFRERNRGVRLHLYYTVFEECDAIVRSAELENESEEVVFVKRLLSSQLDFKRTEMVFCDFTGHWGKEMKRSDHRITAGKHVCETRAGVSSNRANPFVMLKSGQTGEERGWCIGSNLIYSGNHYEAAEVSGHGKVRFVTGIQPQGFCFRLKKGETFESPEAVTVFSDKGIGEMSRRMHRFVREHVVRGEWKKKERPVLVNSWEASYFKFKESSLIKLAKKAKEVGAELFVLDDGWFGKRDSDTSSLGDWQENKAKLPEGIAGLCEKINALGLDFGIWVEPEMVNEDSDCCRTHPDYAVRIPGRENALGRNQMFLDLTRKEVQEFVIEEMTRVFSTGKISYVKWDMNRIFSDTYSAFLDPEQAGEFQHRYMIGLYHVLGTLTQSFPHILFEGCASGGGRFDLGILCYFPQIWASDNTDAHSRMEIQRGYSYGYPLSVIGAHVSNCPNHQTLRTTPLETRFHVAEFGLLGLELNLCEMKKEEFEEAKDQIAVYKKWRQVFQFGDFYRLGDKSFQVLSGDKARAAVLLYQDLTEANTVFASVHTKGLLEEEIYHIYNRRMKYNIKNFGDLVNTISPVHIRQDSVLHNGLARVIKLDGETEDYCLSGSVLNTCGLCLKQGFGATGYNENTRYFPDFATRLYYVEKNQQLFSK